MKRQSPTAGFARTSSNAAMKDPSVEASMLISRPPGEVFAAFVNPQTLRKFWLTDASGPLAPGARVQWQFMVPGATAKVAVTRFEAPRHLAFDWDDTMHVDMSFELFGDGGTHDLRAGERIRRRRRAGGGHRHGGGLRHRALRPQNPARNRRIGTSGAR